MIKPPFSGYHRAKLERLVALGYEEIERNAHRLQSAPGNWNIPIGLPMDPFDFQVLLAADAYLRNTQ